jgi:four helix bundle protein
MAYVANFRELEVYKASRLLAEAIYSASKKFPREEMYSLTDQIRRSSRSVGGQIAEAWGKRRYVNHFISKLTDADGEQYETQHWIEIASDCNYINQEEAAEFFRQCSSIGRMLHSMIAKADQFCLKPESTEH